MSARADKSPPPQRLRWGWLAVVASLLTSNPARADDAAERLFEEGLDAMLAGNYEAGCPALAESYRLDPLPGALFTLAECQAKWGRSATALSHYRDYLSQVERMAPANKDKQQQRVTVAEAQVEVLEGEAPRLVLRLVETPPAGTVVRRDGKIVPLSQLGLPILVDPGSHELRVTVEGRPEPWTTTVEIRSNSQEQVTLRLPGADSIEDPAGESWTPYVGWGLVGLGGAGLVVGAITGGVTVGHAATVDEECVGNLCRSQDGVDAADAAATTGAVSTVGFVVGGAALAAGVLVLLLLPDDDGPIGDEVEEAGLRVGPSDLGAGFKVTW